VYELGQKLTIKKVASYYLTRLEDHQVDEYPVPQHFSVIAQSQTHF